MTTSFHLHSSELNENFLNTLKKLFENKTIDIKIKEAAPKKKVMDETEYLMSSEANRKHLDEAIKSPIGTSFTINELKQHVKDLRKKTKKAAWGL